MDMCYNDNTPDSNRIGKINTYHNYIRKFQ